MLLVALSLAAAQDTVTGGDAPALNSQIFRPSIDSHSFFRILDTDLPVQRFSAGGLLSYTKSPLQYTTADGTTTDIVANLMQLDVMGAVRLGPVRLGLDLPIYLRNFGGTSPDATGIGDLAIDGKVRILDPEKAPVGLAGAVRVYVPVSTVPEGLGAGGAGLDLGVGLTRPIGEKLTTNGTVYEKQGKYEKALEKYNESMDIKIRTLPWTHPDLAITSDNMAAVYA
ncbi:MAG TPA: tetratricopeptide repeat protein, partial [Myxococcota bacterium]|nr:tetratricopeptide repeat protein [Myxococcota bacterium]